MFERFKKIVNILAFASVYYLVRSNHDFNIIQVVIWWVGIFSYGIYVNIEDKD